MREKIVDTVECNGVTDMTSKRALITGIGGQDGSFLAEILADRGYCVYGTSRKSSVDNMSRLHTIWSRIHRVYRADVTDGMSIQKAILDSLPDVIFHMADQDNIGWSNDLPAYSVDVTVKGTTNVLEIVKEHLPKCKVFLPSSATIFGDTAALQNESTRHNPLSPYACAKAHVYHLGRYYRHVHEMKVSVGIMYNHHSLRRQKGYLMDQIIDGANAIKEGRQKYIELSYLDMRVDVGYAAEYMGGVVRMMELDYPTDMIFATGKAYKIGDIATHYLTQITGDSTNKIRIREDKSNSSLSVVDLVGDVSKAEMVLDWKPKYDAMNLLETMK